MEFRDAALRVLADEGAPLHWTVIQDRALKRGYLDPFTQPDVRGGLLAALREAERDGAVRRVSTGVWTLALAAD